MSLSEAVAIPKVIADKVRSLGADLESYVVEKLLHELKLDPNDEARVHFELAEKYFREGSELVDKDSAQASEKLYKAAEEVVKALAYNLGLTEVLGRVKERGRWTVTDLEVVAREAARRIDEEIYIGWDRANYLHVWGFHEGKLDKEAVKERLPYIERMIKILREASQKRPPGNP